MWGFGLENRQNFTKCHHHHRHCRQCSNLLSLLPLHKQQQQKKVIFNHHRHHLVGDHQYYYRHCIRINNSSFKKTESIKRASTVFVEALDAVLMEL